MNERVIKRGDLVRVKDEYLNPGEDGSTTYVVLEQVSASRIHVQALGTGLAIAPTYIYDVEWVYYAGSVPANMFK